MKIFSKEEQEEIKGIAKPFQPMAQQRKALSFQINQAIQHKQLKPSKIKKRELAKMHGNLYFILKNRQQPAKLNSKSLGSSLSQKRLQNQGAKPSSKDNENG